MFKKNKTITITPPPNLDEYVAEEWHDVKGLSFNEIAPIYEQNEWFNLPLTEKRRE